MTVEYKNMLSETKAFVISTYYSIRKFEWWRASDYVFPKLWKADDSKDKIKSLNERIAALQQAQIEAGKNALDLYAENEALRRYRDLCVHGQNSFVTYDDHNALQRKLEDTEKKLAAVSRANDVMMEAWNAYMVEHD